LGAQFDGKRGKGSAFGADVAKFGKRLARVHQLPPELWRMLNELPVVDFEPGSDAHGDLRFYWQWPDDMELGSRLPKRANRALVISPFVRAGLLHTLCDRAENLTIVSTQAELDALPDDVYSQFREADTYVVTGNGTDDVPALDLHAKLLAWEQGDTRETLVGSANATGAAWGLGGHSNVEAMVSVRPGLRIDDVLRAFVSPEKGRLHGWVEHYERAKLEPDEAELARKRLTDLHRQLATIDLRAEYDAKGFVLTLRGRGRPPRPLLTPPVGVDVDVVPLLRADDDAAWRPLRSAYEDGARFDRVGLAELCAFAIVRLRDRSHQREHRFGIQCDLRLDEADVDRRDAALHGRLLEGIDPRALILNVLRGLPAGSGLFHHGVAGSDGRFIGRSVLQHATFERVMEACTSDPSRIEEVDAILKACGEADGMDSFVTFWEAFKSALREVPRG